MNQLELIKACKQKDRIAQKELFQRHKDSLYLLSLKYCRNTKEAEDNLHDAFITIFQTIQKYNGKGSFEGWMKRITINKAIDKFKHQIKNNAEPDINLESLNDQPEAWIDITLDELLALIQNLPDQYRMVFNLYQLDGYSHKEVAKMLGISENTSKSNYHRAKNILRKEIMQKPIPKSN